MFHDMDITHSGEVDYTEFIAAANAQAGFPCHPALRTLCPAREHHGGHGLLCARLTDAAARGRGGCFIVFPLTDRLAPPRSPPSSPPSPCSTATVMAPPLVDCRTARPGPACCATLVPLPSPPLCLCGPGATPGPSSTRQGFSSSVAWKAAWRHGRVVAAR